MKDCGKRPTAALLIPCYNAERYLEALRRQVDALGPAFDEVIVVDDGSTDDTVVKAGGLGFDIRPLGVNRGPGAARNAAAQMASAEWVHFLDADDEIAPHYLDAAGAHATDDADVILSSTEFLDEETRRPFMKWSYSTEEFSSNAVQAAIVRPVLLHSSLIRRSCFEGIGGFSERHRCWEDGDMHVRLAAAGSRFRCIPDLLAFSPRHKRGTSGNDLYCHRCRLDFLESYESLVPRISREALLAEVLVNASNLHEEGDGTAFRRAIDLAFRLGWNGPESGSAPMRMLAGLPSKFLKRTLFAAQLRARQ